MVSKPQFTDPWQVGRFGSKVLKRSQAECTKLCDSLRAAAAAAMFTTSRTIRATFKAPRCAISLRSRISSEFPLQKSLRYPILKNHWRMEMYRFWCTQIRDLKLASRNGHLEHWELKMSQDTQPPLTPRQGLDYRGRVSDASP